MTSALVAKWCAAALGQAPEPGKKKKNKQGKGGADEAAGAPGAPALGSFGYLIRAYRLACHYGDPSGAGLGQGGGATGPAKKEEEGSRWRPRGWYCRSRRGL